MQNNNSRIIFTFEPLDINDVEKLKIKIPKDDREFYNWIKRHKDISKVLEISSNTYIYYTSDTYVKLQKVLLANSRLEAGYLLLKEVLGLKNEDISRELLLRATVITDVLVLLFGHIVKGIIPKKLPIPVSSVIEQLEKEYINDYMFG